jgi:hypothetical protein
MYCDYTEPWELNRPLAILGHMEAAHAEILDAEIRDFARSSGDNKRPAGVLPPAGPSS